ncbi:hypothetical protein sphantq_04403 (plasmid) [Sphingobium sp. AntQ-1]|nr:hypothetical protein sphantq_04403 [Sphingobium sp. AntQ-1]
MRRHISDCVNSFALCSAVVVINTIALIMPPDETRSYEVRDGSADVAPTRASHSRPYCSLHELIGFNRVTRQHVLLR